MQHDYPANCLTSETGYYVMHPMGGLNGFLDTNYQFSDCSIKNISLTMAALKTLSRNCLQQGRKNNFLNPKIYLLIC
jgi:hypothetical protein